MARYRRQLLTDTSTTCRIGPTQRFKDAAAVGHIGERQHVKRLRCNPVTAACSTWIRPWSYKLILIGSAAAVPPGGDSTRCATSPATPERLKCSTSITVGNRHRWIEMRSRYWSKGENERHRVEPVAIV